jgi:uncharacterized protein (TIGR02246 family)
MKFRPTLPIFVGLAVASCAGETGDATAEMEMAEPAVEDVVSADEAALNAFAASYAEHYNMGHASMVAEMHAADAMTLLANGSVNEGMEAITASLEEAMAPSPTLSIDVGDTMVFGDWAVARGAYGVDVTPEGAEAISTSGHYMTVFSRQQDAWKIAFLITNYDAVPPEGFPSVEGDAEPPVEEGTMTDLVAAYVEHFNAGHASMVAGLYAEDAVSAFSNLPLAEGRAAIEATLGERLAMGSPQLTLHDVGTLDLGDGWAVDGGWY